MNTKLIIIGVLIAVFLIGGAVFLKNKNNQNKNSISKLEAAVRNLESGNINEKYKFSISAGDPGSEHSHVGFKFFIDDEPIDFSKTEYMLMDKRVHLENGDGFTIHKHATGVNLPFFFASLDIRINRDCFMLDITKEHCSDGVNRLTFIINGEEMEDIYRELRDGDRILVNYGGNGVADLRAKFDSVPNSRVSANRI